MPRRCQGFVQSNDQPSPSAIEFEHRRVMSDKVVSDLGEKGDALCQQWTTTIASFTEKAMLLQQLSSLMHALESNDPEAIEKLHSLEKTVVELEEKVELLQGILEEEAKAIDKLESLSKEADRRAEVLQNLKNRMLTEKKIDSSSSSKYGDELKAASNDKLQSAAPRRHSTHSASRSHHKESSSTPKKIEINLPHISQEELNTIPRTIRGRVPLAVLNEAIEDVEEFAKLKTAEMARDRRKMMTWMKAYEDIGEELYMTEQELRQSCAFFCSGESTARSVLLILRALNRLKQVPAKNGDVVYMLP